MPIRPIDILLMPPKSQEASTQNVAAINKTVANNLAQESIYQQEIKHNMQQPVKLEKSRDNEFRYKDKKDGHGSNSSGQKQHTKDNKDEKRESSTSKGHIDIRI